MLLLLLACTAPVDDIERAETLTLAADIADRGKDIWPVERLPFDWMQTVWAFGLHRLDARQGGQHAYYAAWMADNVERFEDGAHFVSSDSMSPATLASVVMVEDATAELTPITDAGHAYLAEAPRTTDGAIQHWAEGSPFGDNGQVWVDSQFMFGMFLLSEYRRTGDDALLDTWTEQYLLFSQLCRNEDAQLYHHAWDDIDGVNIPVDPVFWNRGNSWVLLSAAEMLRLVGPEDARWEQIQPLFEAHASATLALQADDGLWYTVLNKPDHPDNYTETSGSALIAYAFYVGHEAGALDDAYQDAAYATVDAIVADRIDDDLTIEGTSFGTNPGDLEYYLDVVQLDDIILGVGSVVMLLAETSP
jgi:rhamnogalacturonyl hydrolase YesR